MQAECINLLCGKELCASTRTALLGDRTKERFKLFYDKAMKRAGKCDNIGNPKLPRRKKNMRNFFHTERTINITGHTSTSQGYHHDDVVSYYRQLYYECIDSPVSNLRDRFDQETIYLLSDVETLFVFALNNASNLSTTEYDEKLGLKGVLHFSDDIDAQRLKWEFMNMHTQCKRELSGNFDCFHDVLDLFAQLKKGSFN